MKVLIMTMIKIIGWLALFTFPVALFAAIWSPTVFVIKLLITSIFAILIVVIIANNQD